MLNKAKPPSGYKLADLDGGTWKVKEFYFDGRYWAIRYLVADTGNWLMGRQALISPQWIERLSWNEAKVFVNLNRAAIKQSPEYTAIWRSISPASKCISAMRTAIRGGAHWIYSQRQHKRIVAM